MVYDICDGHTWGLDCRVVHTTTPWHHNVVFVGAADSSNTSHELSEDMGDMDLKISYTHKAFN